MRVYRIYETAVARIKVSGCAECPGKDMQKYCIDRKFSTGAVCKRITKTNTVKLGGEFQTSSYHPSVKDAIQNGGVLYDCPLPIEEVE